MLFAAAHSHHTTHTHARTNTWTATQQACMTLGPKWRMEQTHQHMKCNEPFGRVASDQLCRRVRNELRDAHLHGCVGCRMQDAWCDDARACLAACCRVGVTDALCARVLCCSIDMPCLLPLLSAFVHTQCKSPDPIGTRKLNHCRPC